MIDPGPTTVGPYGQCCRESQVQLMHAAGQAGIVGADELLHL